MKKLYILTLFICLAGFGNSFAQTLKGHIYMTPIPMNLWLAPQ